MTESNLKQRVEACLTTMIGSAPPEGLSDIAVSFATDTLPPKEVEKMEHDNEAILALCMTCVKGFLTVAVEIVKQQMQEQKESPTDETLVN